MKYLQNDCYLFQTTGIPTIAKVFFFHEMEGVCLGSCAQERLGVNQLSGNRCQVRRREGKDLIRRDRTGPGLPHGDSQRISYEVSATLCIVAFLLRSKTQCHQSGGGWREVRGLEYFWDTSLDIFSYFSNKVWRNLWWYESQFPVTKCKAVSAVQPWLVVKDEPQPQLIMSIISTVESRLLR